MAVDIIIMYCPPKFLKGEFFAKFLRGIFCNVHGFLAISKVYNEYFDAISTHACS